MKYGLLLSHPKLYKPGSDWLEKELSECDVLIVYFEEMILIRWPLNFADVCSDRSSVQTCLSTKSFEYMTILNRTVQVSNSSLSSGKVHSLSCHIISLLEIFTQASAQLTSLPKQQNHNCEGDLLSIRKENGAVREVVLKP